MKNISSGIAAILDRQSNTVRIPADVDRRFRNGLLKAARQKGGQNALWNIRTALEHGPSRGGLAEAMRHFGWTDTNHPSLVLTAQIVDGIEITLPGFKRWLELSGFGNDRRMIQGFIAWAEYRNGQGHAIGEAKQAFQA